MTLLKLAAIPLIILAWFFKLGWECFYNVVTMIDRAIDKVFEEWI